jgi:hypothetical protein
MISKDPEKVFGFLSNPKYLNIYPKMPGIENQRIEHLNSLPYGLGKQLRMRATRDDQEFIADIEIYKFEPPAALGFKLIKAFNRKTKKAGEKLEGFVPEFTFDWVLEAASAKTRLKSVVYINNVNSTLVRVLMYIAFGVFGYYRNKQYVKELGQLIEKSL